MNINLQKFPNFLIVGVNKGGTTSIHYYCNQHPDICMSRIKEPMFFSKHSEFFSKHSKIHQNKSSQKKSLSNPKFVTSLEEYQDLFKGKERSICRGEASTAYFANPDTAIPRIKEIYPQMKIIACLRHPIDRALSNYYMYLSEGIEKRSFEQCVKDEVEGKLQGIPQGRRYLTLGLYYTAVKKYMEAFGNENVLILFYDDLLREPDSFMKKIFHFLQVDDEFTPNIEKKLNTSEGRKKKFNIDKPEIEQKVYEICVDFFKEDINKLSTIVEFRNVIWNGFS